MKNLVFDIGNVMLKWSPQDIVKTVFPNDPQQDILIDKLFKSKIWIDLNAGKITEKEATKLYMQEFPTKTTQLETLMSAIKESLTPLQGSLELLEKAYQSGKSIYSITDNVQEIMAYMKNKYDFFNKFQGIVMSADIGVLKPDPKIYETLLTRYSLVPSETIFMDDLLPNVDGARKVGMHGIHFTTADACHKELKDKFGVVL